MLVARFGYVDKHGGCKPSKDRGITSARETVMLTSKPFFGIRVPVLRTAVRIGVFLENVEGDGYDWQRSAFVKSEGYTHPKLVLQVKNGNAITFRVKPTYRMAVNRYGGELLMLQMHDECVVYPEYGTHLGTIELQYPLFSAPGRIECHISVFTPSVSNEQLLTILVYD